MYCSRKIFIFNHGYFLHREVNYFPSISNILKGFVSSYRDNYNGLFMYVTRTRRNFYLFIVTLPLCPKNMYTALALETPCMDYRNNRDCFCVAIHVL